MWPSGRQVIKKTFTGCSSCHVTSRQVTSGHTFVTVAHALLLLSMPNFAHTLLGWQITTSSLDFFHGPGVCSHIRHTPGSHIRPMSPGGCILTATWITYYICYNDLTLAFNIIQTHSSLLYSKFEMNTSVLAPPGGRLLQNNFLDTAPTDFGLIVYWKSYEPRNCDSYKLFWQKCYLSALWMKFSLVAKSCMLSNLHN